MKKIIYFSIVFFLSYLSLIGLGFSDCTPSNPCCCADKCYTSGVCCRIDQPDEYWAESCYRFKVWVEPESASFVVGHKTPINLYIENTGDYTDNYRITYNISNPNLALVDITGISEVKNVGPDEIRKINPRITVLSSLLQGNVYFNVTSDSGFINYARLDIRESELPLSLPEFGFFGLIIMIIMAGIVYFLIKKKH